MKTIKITFYSIGIFFLLACNNGNAQKNNSEANKQSKANNGMNNTTENIAMLQSESMKGIEATKYNEFIDQKNGLVQTRYPIPKSWNVNSVNSPIYIEGPQGLKVHKMESESYAWSNDPMVLETIQMSGHAIGQPISNQQLLNQVIKPNAQSQGYKFLKSYEVPEVSGLYQKLFNAMPNTGSQRRVEAMATEWENNQGSKSMILMVRYDIIKSQVVNWTIQTTEIEASDDYFAQAKNAYIYSLANAQINPQWIQVMNGQLMHNIQKSNEFWNRAAQQSAAAHAQRMQAIAAAGNTSRSIGDTYSDILDISHKGYLNRSNMNDVGHSKTIRGINETTLIGNHETREQYNVPSGSNYYWVSNQGTYIGTDNALFDPNIDNRTNDDSWTKFAKEY